MYVWSCEITGTITVLGFENTFIHYINSPCNYLPLPETWPLKKSDERKLWFLKIKILRKIFKPISGEWRIRKNVELKTVFQKPTEKNNKILQWAGHAWRSQNPLIHVLMLKENFRKRPLGRPVHLRWENVVRKDMEALGRGLDWKIQASDKENWRQGCMTGWS